MLLRPAPKLGAYAVILAAALGGGALAGAAWGPEPSTGIPTHDDGHVTTTTSTTPTPTTFLTLPDPAQREQVSGETVHHG